MENQENFFRQRITSLRLQTGVSEYQMSMDLGKSKGYIQQISSGRALPQMKMFFEICDYLSVTPLEFFTPENRLPSLTRDLAEKAQGLDAEKIEALITVADFMK